VPDAVVPRIAIVDDLEPNALLLAAMLEGLMGAEIVVFTSAREAVSWCVANDPDLVLLDYQMPDIDGLTCLRQLRQMIGALEIPVIMVTSDASSSLLQAAFDEGATDFLRKPVEETELLARSRNLLRLRSRERALMQANATLDRLANEDSLTGCVNRRRFMDLASAELERARRHRRPVSLALLDLDRFKSINDTLGHAAGDAALVALVETGREVLRGSDVMARIGGEEFVALLPETPLVQALDAAERLRVGIAAREVVHDRARFTMTASVGVAEWMGPEETLDDILRRADSAMYQAKAGGRNRVVAAAPAQKPPPKP